MLLLLALALAQTTAEEWVERLASERPEIRSQAERELLRLGSAAKAVLEVAARGEDLEVVSRARDCLRRIAEREELTPRLLAVPELEERLRHDGGPAWSELLREILHPGTPVEPYDDLGRDDLAALARGALKRDPDPARQMQTLTSIGLFRLEGARPAVEALLRDPRLETRAWAAWALIALRGPRVLEEADRFLKDPETMVRSRVLGALVHAKVHEAIPRLLALTPDDGIDPVQLEYSLMQAGVKRPTPFLERNSDDPALPDHTRSSTAMTLAFQGTPDHLPHMRRLLHWAKKDPNTANAALMHLGAWGDRASVPALEELIQDKSLWAGTPDYACRALFFVGARSSLPALLRETEQRPGEVVVHLGLIGDPAAIPVLRKLMARYPGPAVLVALGRLGDRNSAPALRTLLSHPDHEVREGACTALALLEDVDAIPEMAELRREAAQARKIWPALGDDGIQDAAVYGIGQGYGASEFAPQFREGPHTSHENSRHYSVRAAATSTSTVPTDTLLHQVQLGWGLRTDLTPAAALVRRGRVEGVEPLLDERRPLFSLNRLRRPEAFARLEQRTIRLRVYGTYEEIHRRLAREAGLALEAPPAGSDAHQAWSNVHQSFEKWGAPPTLAQSFDMLEDDRWGVVLEDDRLRVLPLEEAMAFWRAWQKTLGK